MTKATNKSGTKVRVNVTVIYPEGKSVVDAGKKSEIKDSITSELGQIALDAFVDYEPSDLNIRFLRK